MRKTYRIISFGGIGDALLTTPVFKALKERDPACIIKVYCVNKKHLSIYRYNPHIDRLAAASFWKQPVQTARYFLNPAYARKKYFNNEYGRCAPSKSYETHASRIIADMMGIEIQDETLQVFLTPAEEKYGSEVMSAYHNPVIIHAIAACSGNKHWTQENWEQLVDTMPECTFIQLGLLSEQPIRGTVDFRGKASIRESIALIKYAKSFVGVDSSFAHACNAVGTPGVVVFGPSTPVIWGHRTNVNIFKGVSCSPCIDVLSSSGCPYNTYCMKNITVSEVKAALELQMNKLPVKV